MTVYSGRISCNWSEFGTDNPTNVLLVTFGGITDIREAIPKHTKEFGDNEEITDGTPQTYNGMAQPAVGTEVL